MTICSTVVVTPVYAKERKLMSDAIASGEYKGSVGIPLDEYVSPTKHGPNQSVVAYGSDALELDRKEQKENNSNQKPTVNLGWIKNNATGKWYFFYADSTMAENTIIGGYKIGAGGAWIQIMRSPQI